MSIVVITIPGEDKRAFVNSLHKETGESVELVIIQKLRKPNTLETFNKLYKTVGPWKVLKEAFYALLLRVDEKAREALEYFRERSVQVTESVYLPKVLETNSINREDVSHIIKDINPDLLVIWGSAVVKSHILKSAKRCINLHMGLCPYYRGAVANQRALMLDDTSHIGATIHYAEPEVDAGDILQVIKAPTTKPPKTMFRELNDLAYSAYIDIARRLHQGEMLETISQKGKKGENFLLKEWTPSVRYRLAKKLLALEIGRMV